LAHIYIYAFCIKFQCEFNCDVYFAIGLTYYGNFENWHIYIYTFGIKFQCEFNCDAHFAIELPYYSNL